MAMTYLGETLSLATAVSWATAVILFKKSGESVHPVALNLFKNVLATLLFVPTLVLFRVPFGEPRPVGDWLVLLGSGVLGIGIADAVFFRSLNLLGAGLSSIVDCLYSPFVIALSLVFLGESLSLRQVAGAALIITAIVLISPRRSSGGEPRAARWEGILLGALSMLAMAVGIVVAKPVLERTPLLWATEVRLVGGVGAGVLTLLLMSNRRAVVQSLTGARNWNYILPGSFIGAYISMLIWLGGMKYTQASVSSALNQTSNVFIFVFAAVFLGEAVTWRRVAGLVLAVGGAVLVFAP